MHAHLLHVSRPYRVETRTCKVSLKPRGRIAPMVSSLIKKHGQTYLLWRLQARKIRWADGAIVVFLYLLSWPSWPTCMQTELFLDFYQSCVFTKNTNEWFTWVKSSHKVSSGQHRGDFFSCFLACKRTQTVFTCEAGLHHCHVTGMPSDRPLTKDNLNPSSTSRPRPATLNAQLNTKLIAFVLQIMHFLFFFLVTRLVNSY